MYKWIARVKTQWGNIDVYEIADNHHIAKSLIESKHGSGSIIGNEVRLLGKA